MNPRRLPLISGVAVDATTTDYRHQIFNITYDEKECPRILHYTVHRPEIKYSSEDLLIENMCDVLTDERALKTPDGANRAHSLFSRFISKIKEGNTSQFILNQECPSLTYDIFLDDDLRIYDMDLRATNSVMIHELSCKKAQSLVSLSQDRDLKTWHDVVVQAKYGEPIKRILEFEDVINTTSDIVQENLAPYVIDNAIACIFKIKPEVGFDGKYPKKYQRFYSSTFDFSEDIRRIGCNPSRAIISATASRDPIQCINIVSANAFKETGQNIFKPHIIRSIAQYKMGVAA